MMADGAPNLGGRTAIVTGGSRGIGRAVAAALVGAGAEVLIVARSELPLRAAAREMGARSLAADTASEAGVRAITDAVEEAWGRAPDIVVNSAGAFHLAPFAETPPERVETQLQTNVVGPFRLIRAFLPDMITRGSGDLVNVGSVAGRAALPGNAGYAASKYGLRGMHEVLAVELRGTGVRATLLDPAATDTPLWDPLDPDSRADLPSRASMLRPDAVADALLYVVTRPAGVEISTLSIQAIG